MYRLERTYLELCTQRHYAHLVRPNDSLASLLNTLVLPQLRHTIREEQEDKTPMQKVYAKKVGHKGEFRIEAEDVGDGLGGFDGVGCALGEARGCYPVVLVVKHAYSVPFAVEEDVEDVKDEGAVSDDEAYV